MKSLRARMMLSIFLVIAIVATANLFVNVYRYQEQAQEQMREKAKVLAEQLVSMRKFVEDEQAKDQDRGAGFYDEDGDLVFRHINPARVTQRIGNIFSDTSEYTYKQTNLTWRVEASRPDDYEREQMLGLSTDPTKSDSFGIDTVNGVEMYRYIYPLYYQESCLSCHGQPKGEKDFAGFSKEGGNLGGFAGALSISFPTQSVMDDVRRNTIVQAFFWLGIFLITFLVMYLIMGRIVVRPLKRLTTHVNKLGSMEWDIDRDEIEADKTVAEIRQLGTAFSDMSDKLRNSYANLEEKIEERTFMLQKANEQLNNKGAELHRINTLLSDADRMKSEMMATISSGLRKPLTSIMTISQMMLTNPGSPESQKQFLGGILGNVQSLDDQLSNLMAMSQIEAGLMALEYTEFDLEDIAADLRKIMEPICERKSLKFAVDLDVNMPTMVADLEKIMHILRNLLNNSYKFTPEGGWIRVRIEALPFSRENNRELVLIQVTDSGVGIKEEDLPEIFTRMWQNKGDDDPDQKSGLGLAIVKIFVELHGGTIDMKSTLNQGTHCSLLIPRNP
jgi:signal transduction histidine kinase